MRTKKYFVGGDQHVVLKDGKIGGVDLVTNNAVVSFLEEEGPWDGYINLGDTYDMNVISSHNLNNLRAVRGESVEGQYRAGNAYLTQHWKASGVKRMEMLEGNHEYRVERYISANPELENLLEVERHLPDFVNWIPFWSRHEILTVGKATFIHGRHITKNHPELTLRDYGQNVFYGHTHDMVSAALRHHGADSTKLAHSLGCLCEYNQPYLRGGPTKWSQGFAVFHFWPDGKFNYFPVHIFDHAFVSPSGKYYDGKRERPDTKLVLV